ncbi:MAG: O-methyltransferase [Candidatus Eisenbacteria bacterium]
MSMPLWSDVDAYFSGVLLPPDPALAAALAASAAAGLPTIHVAPNQGKLLYLFARMIGAKRVLEVGTLGGYSTLWLARALPADGRVVTLESDPKHAAVARANFAAAGLTEQIELREGRALDTLPALAASDAGSFDLVFIDADKPSNPDYFEWALRLTHRGSLILVDNVVREGAVIDAGSTDVAVIGVRRLMELVAAQSRVSATVLQTVGAKGYDGFLMAMVTADA